MSNEKRVGHAAMGKWVAACCAIVVTAAMIQPAAAAVSVTATIGDAVPGGTATLTLSMSGAGTGSSTVASFNTDLIFDTSQLQLMGTCANAGTACQNDFDCPAINPQQHETCGMLSCQPDSRLPQGTAFVATVPIIVPNLPAGEHNVRLALVPSGFPVPTFGDGPLATCTFQVPTTAPLGQFTAPTAQRFQVGDNLGNELSDATITVQAGSIVSPTVTPTDTPTVTETPTGPTGTPTDTATETPTGPTATPTETPTVTGTPPTGTPTQTPTLTPTGPTSTPTTPVPPPNTATPTPTTPVPPSNTPTPTTPVAPTLTPTSTATRPPATSTPTSTAKPAGGGGGGGCVIAPPATGGSAGLWFAVPVALLLWRRRRPH